MGIVYEHWRPDTNECFYVGASCVGEERAQNFTPRNSSYQNVLNILKKMGLNPFHKIIWDNLDDEVAGTYEKIRISYQKSLVGENLTNIAIGGFGLNLEWTPELAERHRLACKEAQNRPETKELQRKVQKESKNRPEVIEKLSRSLIAANAKPEVQQRRSVSSKAAHARPDVIERRKEREKNPELREKRKASAKLGGLKAGEKPKEELTLRGKKAAQTALSRGTHNSLTMTKEQFAARGRKISETKQRKKLERINEL